MFAVVRHPDIATLGIIPQATLEAHQARGWVRVSEYRREPADFHLPDFAEAFDDLDAKPVKPIKRATAEEQEA